MKKRNIYNLLFYVLSAEIIGAISALLSGGFSDFFNKYDKPPLMPPSWLFPVVWVILYAVMGFSAYIIDVSDSDADIRKKALTFYWSQLAVNFFWSIAFFRFEALWGAFAIIILLLALITGMIVIFKKISPFASSINIPYIIWVIFASYLNFATAFIN